MIKFLSNDRKVILASGTTGTMLIFFFSLLYFTKVTFLVAIAAIAILSIYWYLPTWFSRNRQVIIIKGKSFNADNEQLKTKSFNEEMIHFAAFLFTCTFLMMYAYDAIAKYFIKQFPQNGSLILYLTGLISILTPYLIRHSYCFIVNRPMNTSFQISWIAYRPILDYRKGSTSTSPRYAFLPYNIFHHRN